MFEDSLFASRVQGRAARPRWATVTAVAVQGLLVAGLLVAPMLRPVAMPALKTAPETINLGPRRPEVKPEPMKATRAVANDTMMHVPASAAATTVESRQGGRISLRGGASDAGPVLAMGAGMGTGMESGPGLSSGLGAPTAPIVRIKASSGAALRISSGVSSGMLLGAIRPLYPAIARAARVEGTVVITAKIDKAGHITGMQVASGPEMLRSAALDAVKEARYRPYLLNGEPTEVETTIAVNFRMGS